MRINFDFLGCDLCKYQVAFFLYFTTYALTSFTSKESIRPPSRRCESRKYYAIIMIMNKHIQYLKQKLPAIKKKLKGFAFYFLPILISLGLIGYLVYWLYPEETKQTVEKVYDYFNAQTSDGVYIHLNKDKYIQGDNIYFSIKNSKNQPIYYMLDSSIRPEFNWQIYPVVGGKIQKQAFNRKISSLLSEKTKSLAGSKSIDLVTEIPWEKEIGVGMEKALMDEIVKYPEIAPGTYVIGFKYSLEQENTGYNLIKPIYICYSDPFQVEKKETVIVKTKKLKFQKEEPINFSIVDTYKKPIYFFHPIFFEAGMAYHSIETNMNYDLWKKEEDDWIKQEFIKTELSRFNTRGGIISQVAHVYNFSLSAIKEKFAKGEYSSKYFQLLKDKLEPGVYKISFTYSFEGEKEDIKLNNPKQAELKEPLITIYSNEFRVE